MPTLTDEFNIEALFSLFKGEPGTRKSTCALSYPQPQFWLSWDKKMRSMLLPMKHFGINPNQVHYEDYSDWSKAEMKLKQLQTDCPYKTVIADSITSCGDSIMGQTKKLKVGSTRKSGATAGKLVGGIGVNELEDYNAEASALLDMISMLKDIHQYHKVHVILIAHVIQVEYKSVTGETHFSRSIVTAAKKVAAKIPAYCEEVYHFNIDKGDFAVDAGGSYALLTEHTGDDFARTSLPLPKKVVFGNENLYSKYILPAMNELKGSKPAQTTTDTKTTW
jgi:AAA domain